MQYIKNIKQENNMIINRNTGKFQLNQEKATNAIAEGTIQEMNRGCKTPQENLNEGLHKQ